MDIPLHYFDEWVGDSLYSKLSLPSQWPSTSAIASAFSDPSNLTHTLSKAVNFSALPRDNILRQCLTLYALTYIGILVLYFGVATASYYLIFDHRMKSHPRYLPNQVRKEIMFSLEAFPMLDLLTLPWFVGDVRGYSKMYDTIAEGPFGAQGGWKPWAYMVAASAVFLLFTDFAIYWIHRWLHIPFFYKRLHKPHHKWIIPTPFASHAFHPVDGYLQSVPYHLMCYLIPLHKYLFVGLFCFVNLWSIFIHDSDMISNTGWETIINGPAHHTLHHLMFTCNYGQYFCANDRFFGSFRMPASEDDPLLAVLALQAAKKANVERERTELLISDSLVSSRASSEVASSSSSCSDSDGDCEESTMDIGLELLMQKKTQ